jgi:hypothetical protein
MTNAILPNLTEIPLERSEYISHLGHDAEFLFVQFRRDGALFRFDKVTAEEYKALMDAPSLGKHFAQHIKGLKPYKRMETSAKVIPMPKPSATGLEAKAKEWASRAMSFVVSDGASHAQAQEVLLTVARVKKEIQDFMEPIKSHAYKAWRVACDQENSLLDPLTEGDKALRRKVGEYTYQQMMLAQEQDRKQREAAEAEAIRKAQLEAEETALRAAAELAALGDHEAAEAVLEHPQPIAPRFEIPPPVRPDVAKVEGMTGQLVYEVTIHDVSMVPRSYLVVDIKKTEAEIARRAKQAGGRLQVPGATIRETYAPRRVGGHR